MSPNKEMLNFLLVEIFVSLLILGGVFAYYASSFASRFLLIATFLIIQIVLAWQRVRKSYKVGKKTVFGLLLLTSLLFLLWRYSYFAPYFMERVLHSETSLLSQQYGESGHISFDSVHSYFFSQPLILYFLRKICGFPLSVGSYLSILVPGILLAVISILLLKTILRRQQTGERYGGTRHILPYIIAFSLVSFGWSERGVGGSFSSLLFLLIIWLVFDSRLKNWRETVILVFLTVGVTLGYTTGILILIPFFLIFPIFGRRKTAILYALIPLSYMIFAAYSYVLSLKRYAAFAWEGFQEFLRGVITGQPSERVAPWLHVSSSTQSDIYITSIAYFSLLIVSSLVAFISMFLWIKERNKEKKESEDSVFWSGSACLWLWLGIAAVTYIGASTKPETPFSDIRTITIASASLMLPFLFTSRRLIGKINTRKIFVSSVMVLLILASMRTIYEIYPKSVNDPINVVEDNRLGSTGIYIVADFLNAHYKSGGIVGDYKVFNRIGTFLPDSQYEKRLLNETTLSKPFARFPYRSILIFNVAGIKYPSVYHSPESYIAAYNFSISHNRLYDNGIVVIASGENGMP